MKEIKKKLHIVDLELFCKVEMYLYAMVILKLFCTAAEEVSEIEFETDMDWDVVYEDPDSPEYQALITVIEAQVNYYVIYKLFKFCFFAEKACYWLSFYIPLI